ncbi:MAG: glycerol kinase GlpK [Candidatus Brocadiia bacterium]
MLILALDLGTTGNRALVFDTELNVRARAYQEFRQHYPKPGWVEHDPLEIWETSKAVVQKVLEDVNKDEIEGVGVTNQRETVVCWDPDTGQPVHNAIVWQDRRTTARCRQLRDNHWEGKIHARTGLRCDPYFSATKIEWLLQNIPETRSGIFGTVDSWILWNLGREHPHATDFSNASRTMLFNIQDKKWDPDLLELFGVSSHALPDVRPSSGTFANLDPDLFGFTAPISGVAGDQQAAMFGQGCFEPGIVKNTYGTGLFLLVNTGAKRQLSENLLSTIAWKIGDRTDYALEGSVFAGGAAVQWLRDGLEIIAGSAETAEMAASLDANDDVYFVPALQGLGAPYWDPRARGIFVGLTGGTKREHFARAALESIAYQTRDVTESMRDELGEPIKKLQADGGACANDWLMQFQADILGVPVERNMNLDTTAVGVAGLAGLHLGVWQTVEDFAAHRKIDRRFEPRMSETEREALYSRWQEAVSRARNWAPRE